MEDDLMRLVNKIGRLQRYLDYESYIPKFRYIILHHCSLVHQLTTLYTVHHPFFLPTPSPPCLLHPLAFLLSPIKRRTVNAALFTFYLIWKIYNRKKSYPNISRPFIVINTMLLSVPTTATAREVEVGGWRRGEISVFVYTYVVR